MKIIERIHNIETGEILDIERDMSLEELANWQANRDAAKAELEAIKETAIAKAALLEKLDITEDEAKLLLS